MRVVLLGIVCLMFFTLFSREVKQGRFTSIDFDVTVKVQDRVGVRMGSFLQDGGGLASPVFSIIVVAILSLLSFKKLRFWMVLIPVAFALMTLAEMYGKSVVHHPAPPFFMLKNPTTVFPTYHVWEEFSYPSGHAARAVFLAIVLFSLTKKRLWVGIGLGIYVCLIALSRIYLGHHWLSDVIGGWLLGGGMSLVAMSAYKEN